MKSAIIVKNLTVGTRHQPILSAISATIASGTITGLIGPSGAGKTTLMRALVGLQRYGSGSISVMGQPAGNAQLRREIGYMTQAPSVYGDLSIDENIHYFADLVGAGSHNIDGIIENVGLRDQRQQMVRTLSGGQRSRVSLAIALLGAPKLLILDEPTVGLDPVLRQELWQLFHRLAAEGTTILVSSHAMDEAEHCDQLILLRDGKILANDTPSSIKKSLAVSSMEEAFIELVKGALQ